MQKRYWLLCGLILLGIVKLGKTQEGGRGVATPSPTSTAPSAPAKLAPDQLPEPLPPSAPVARSTPVPPAQETEHAEPKFMRGNSIALRQAPNAKASILDRLNLGKQVMVLALEGQCSRVRDDLASATAGLRAGF